MVLEALEGLGGLESESVLESVVLGLGLGLDLRCMAQCLGLTCSLFRETECLVHRIESKWMGQLPVHSTAIGQQWSQGRMSDTSKPSPLL